MTIYLPDSAVLRGAAALADAIEIIGADGKTDHDLAKIIVDNEPHLRALIKTAIEHEAEGCHKP